MQYQEISLVQLIHYLEGSATESIRKQVEHELANNPDFVEEFQDWEAFLENSSTREEGLAKMKGFSSEWNQTKIDTSVIEPEAKIVDLGRQVINTQNNTSRKPLFLKLAIAACVILIAGAIISNLMNNPSVQDQVNMSLAQDMSILLSPMAGGELGNMEAYDVYLTQLLSDKNYMKVGSSLDSLLTIHPTESKYRLLQGMNFSLSDQHDNAINTLKNLLKQKENAPEFACSIHVNLAMAYAKSGQAEAFRDIVNTLSTDKTQGFACTEIDATILPKLEAIGSSL